MALRILAQEISQKVWSWKKYDNHAFWLVFKYQNLKKIYIKIQKIIKFLN